MHISQDYTCLTWERMKATQVSWQVTQREISHLYIHFSGLTNLILLTALSMPFLKCSIYYKCPTFSFCLDVHVLSRSLHFLWNLHFKTVIFKNNIKLNPIVSSKMTAKQSTQPQHKWKYHSCTQKWHSFSLFSLLKNAQPTCHSGGRSHSCTIYFTSSDTIHPGYSLLSLGCNTFKCEHINIQKSETSCHWIIPEPTRVY